MIMNLQRTRRKHETGSATIETLLIMPALILMLQLAFIVGRVAVAKAAVREAAQSAAREESLQRNEFAAQTLGQATFNDIINPLDATSFTPLPGNNLQCTSERGNGPDTTAFTNPPGPTGTGAGSYVFFTAICKLAAYRLPGLGSTINITIVYTAYSPLDPFRCHTIPGQQPC